MRFFILGIIFTLVVMIGMTHLLLRISPNSYLHQKPENEDRQMTESFIAFKKNARAIRFSYAKRRPVRYKLIPYRHLPMNRFNERPLHSYHHSAIMPSSLVQRAGHFYDYPEIDRGGYYPPAPTCYSNNNFPSLLYLVIPFGILLFVFTTVTLMQTITITATATAMASSQQQQTQTLMNMNSNTITNTNTMTDTNDINISIIDNMLKKGNLFKNASFTPAFFVYGTDLGTDYYDDGNDTDTRKILRRHSNNLLQLNSPLLEK